MANRRLSNHCSISQLTRTHTRNRCQAHPFRARRAEFSRAHFSHAFTGTLHHLAKLGSCFVCFCASSHSSVKHSNASSDGACNSSERNHACRKFCCACHVLGVLLLTLRRLTAFVRHGPASVWSIFGFAVEAAAGLSRTGGLGLGYAGHGCAGLGCGTGGVGRRLGGFILATSSSPCHCSSARLVVNVPVRAFRDAALVIPLDAAAALVAFGFSLLMLDH